ncbi:MAG: AAA family ATPase, partial [Candidatus Dadabacteria bacterium]|nr:AAA family ATPase [Candidatus Dadabacteria bacterium]
ELGDFTLIAGRNNTGKTFLVYTLYGFLKMWKQWPAIESYLVNRDGTKNAPDIGFERLVVTLVNEGKVQYTLDRATINKERNILIRELAHSFSYDALFSVFSSQRDKFKEAALEIEVGEFPVPSQQIQFNYPTGDIFSISYDKDKLTIVRDRVGKMDLRHVRNELSYLYLRFLFPDLPEAFILSAERFGISLFYKELDFTKNRLVDLLQNIGDAEDNEYFSPYILIDKTTSRYALPIKDNIDYTRSLSDFRNERSEVFEDKLFEDIKEMMSGYYRSSGDEIHFKSKARGQKGFDIPLHLASSSARGLSDLYFFLRHRAKKNQMLIIDEPESHLDTANQILLARLLARFVRAGIKVLVTTHSDYIVKEVNNLIMLSYAFNDKKAVVQKLKYKEEEFLLPSSVRAYVAENNGLVACELDEFGLNMPVFDETIDSINRASNELASHLEEGRHD